MDKLTSSPLNMPQFFHSKEETTSLDSSTYYASPSEYPKLNQEPSEITDVNGKIKKVFRYISLFKTITQKNILLFEMKRNGVNYLVFTKEKEINSKLTEGVNKILEMNEKINVRMGKCFFASAYLKINSHNTDVIWINENKLVDDYGDHNQLLYTNESKNEFMIIDPTMPRVDDTYESILLLASNQKDLKEIHDEVFGPTYVIIKPRTEDSTELHKILKINQNPI
jgi:hypothetical protein